MSIRETTTNEQKKLLRKIRTVSPAVKAAVYGGNIGGPGPTIQFNSDVRLYSLWEALLYVEGYESDGHYSEGTASRAVNAGLQPDEDEQEAEYLEIEKNLR